MKKKGLMLPVAAAFLIPLLVCGKAVDTNLTQYPWYNEVVKVVDLFSYDKMIGIITISVVMLFCMLWNGKMFYHKVVKQTDVFIPLGIYLVAVVLSGVFSPYQKFVLYGHMDRFENIWVLLGYVVICFYCCLLLSGGLGEQSLQRMLVFLCVSMILMGIIGFLQLVGMDFLTVDWIKSLFMPGDLREIELQFTLEKGRSYCTLPNPNYVGVLVSLVLPVLTVLFLETSLLWKKICYGVACFLMIASLIGAKSKSGMLVTVLCLCGVLFCYRRQFQKKMNRWAFIVLGAVSIAILLTGIRLIQKSVDERGNSEAESLIDEIETGEEEVMVKIGDHKLFISLDVEGDTIYDIIRVCDEQGKPYALREEEYDVLHFMEPELSEFTIGAVQYESYIAIDLHEPKRHWYFTNQTADGSYYYITHLNKLDKLCSAQISVFHGLDGKERSISGRGYIWSRTLPLLPKYLLFGCGPDAFVNVFPNHDYLGKAKWGYEDIMLTKPHSFYLQSWVQTGAVSLFAMLFFSMKTLFDLVRYCCSHKAEGGEVKILAGIGIGMAGFLIMGITNDSCIATTLLFWMFSGMAKGKVIYLQAGKD